MEDKIILEIDKSELGKHFSEEQIKGFMRSLDMKYLEAVMYLWFYNNVSCCKNDLKENGRPMYIKFANGVSGIIKEHTAELGKEVDDEM